MEYCLGSAADLIEGSKDRGEEKKTITISLFFSA